MISYIFHRISDILYRNIGYQISYSTLCIRYLFYEIYNILDNLNENVRYIR